MDTTEQLNNNNNNNLYIISKSINIYMLWVPKHFSWAEGIIKKSDEHCSGFFGPARH